MRANEARCVVHGDGPIDFTHDAECPICEANVRKNVELKVIDQDRSITDPDHLVAVCDCDGFTWEWKDRQGYLLSAYDQEVLTAFARGLFRGGITARIAGREVTGARLIATW